MTLLVRRFGTLGAALLAVALPVVASGQGDQTAFTKSMGIDQKLGAKVPLDVTFQDETGATRTFGSLLKGRPVLLIPIPLKRSAGCGVIVDSLEKTLFKAGHANDHAVIQKGGPNALAVGKTVDVVLISLDPNERSTDGAAAKIDFQNKVDPNNAVEPVTALTGDESNIHRMTDALGFRYFYDAPTKAMRNPTGSVLITPDGRISSYTIGNDFPTKVLESNLEIAQANEIGTKADQTQMFGCVQLATSIIERRGKIEGIINGFAVLTLAVVIAWIASMVRSERRRAAGGPA